MVNKMEKIEEETKRVVLSYIKSLDSKKYDQASILIDESVKIIGPAGETFGKPKEFTNMLKRYQGNYSILKMFVEGEDACLLYDFVTPEKIVYMSSWYKVKGGKIVFIRTVFDPSTFS